MNTDFETDLDALLRAQNIYTSAAIDAGACGTDWDYRKKSQRRTELETAKESFLRKYNRGA
jgi:hypothetical protein